MSEKSQISSFYASKKILITGGTGFMGKVLLWKLLDSCPEVDTIYVLVRSKYGKSSMSRKNQLFSSPIFDSFKKNNPEILEKVVFIPGDVAEDGIGLSDADRNTIIDRVSIIFHSAAILKMNCDLRSAINVNTVGTLRMLDMAQKMKNFETFVYISTAYCCCENITVEEKIYPLKHNPFDIIKIINGMEPDLLDMITPKLIYPSPNTYIYSKRLTECLLQNYVTKVPIIVARPSIVLPSFKEPLPGWIDSLNGPVGFFVAGARGILRTTMLNVDAHSDIVPVDIIINSILVLPWANPKEQLLKQIKVYNITQNAYNNLTWDTSLEYFMIMWNRYPPNLLYWYPNENPATKSATIHYIKLIFLHYLPAYIIDFILYLVGQKPFLVRVYDRLRQGEQILKYFTQRRWSFVHNNLLQVEELLNDTDKQLFAVNMTVMGELENYYENVMIAVKVYLFNEDMSRLGAAKRTAKIMYVLDKITLALKYYFLWRIIIFIVNKVLSIINWSYASNEIY